MADKLKIIEEYSFNHYEIPLKVQIIHSQNDFVPIYFLIKPEIRAATDATLAYLRKKMLSAMTLTAAEIIEAEKAEKFRNDFVERALKIIDQEMNFINKKERIIIVQTLANEMLGLSELEYLLSDPHLEEIAINSPNENIWVYHKKLGWLKTEIKISSNESIQNYASIIGRRVGKQITVLYPLMDAYLVTGDRVNATLSPISSHGNTLTIRKFARMPWTMINFIDPTVNTVSPDIVALLWLAIQYELNVLVAGGTASGKTSFLNALMMFTPPNQRVISIEETRELQLPKYLHWLPLATRMPNPEGKGGVEMIDLVVNSLRMRPDRIVLGEIRRQREAEVLFEAMHTGHSVYATLHADRAEQAKTRLISPPIALPEEVLEALHLVVVQYRHRRQGIRRTLEVAELVPTVSNTGKSGVSVNVIYKWKPRKDEFAAAWDATRLYDTINLYTGMTKQEVMEDLAEKKTVLNYMLEKNIKTADEVGAFVANYYHDSNAVLDAIKKGKKINFVGGE